MLYRFGKKLIYKIIFVLMLTQIIILSGCVTNKQLSYRLSPLDTIPKDFSVYFKIKKPAKSIPVINGKIEEISSQMGVPKFLKERTDNISAFSLDDNWGYVVMQGSYPDSFIRDRFEKSEEWKESSYQKVRYYFSDNTKTIIILLKNIIIVSDFPDGNEKESNYADQRAKIIIDIIMSNETVAYPLVANSVFRIISKTPENVFTQFVAENINLDTIKEVNFDIILDKNKKAGGINISFMVEDVKRALLFNSIIRLFISDYVVKKKITDVKTLRGNNSIYRDEVFVYVNILDIPLEKLNTFIADFIIEQP